MNDDTKLLIPFIRSRFDKSGKLNDDAVIHSVKNVLDNLISIIKEVRI
jgi:hypothetical protein